MYLDFIVHQSSVVPDPTGPGNSRAFKDCHEQSEFNFVRNYTIDARTYLDFVVHQSSVVPDSM